MFKNIVLLIGVLMLCACTNVKWANIHNNTTEPLDVKATFSNEVGEEYLNFNLKSGKSGVWVYEQYSWDNSKIEKRLKNIQATNAEGCILNYNREKIEYKVNKTTEEIIIEQQELNKACAAQGK